MIELFWYNIYDTPSEPNWFKESYFMNLKKLTNLNANVPVYIYMLNGNIKYLENKIHCETTKEIMNDLGLHIFLYEPICYKKKSVDQHNHNFYSEIVNYHDEFISDELESIKTFIINNDLKNVTIHTCDYNIEKHFSNYKEYMELRCDDLFLRHYSFFQPEINPDLNFTKKIFSPNWRYTNHRQLVVSFISKLDSRYSWTYTQDFDEFKKKCWFAVEEWKNHKFYSRIVEGFEYINQNSPFVIDLNFSGAINVKDFHYPEKSFFTPAGDNFDNYKLNAAYNDSFCVVVTESRFAQPTANFSEKLLDAIRYKKPFVLVAPPKTLEYFKSFGFKTFSNFWDESYDNCIEHDERMFKIFDIIDSINSKSLEELMKMYVQMKHIIDHNYDCLLSFAPFKNKIISKPSNLYYHNNEIKLLTRTHYNFLMIEKSVTQVKKISTKPFFVYTGNQEIDEIKDLNHTHQEINYFNRKGLNFYLYEPLCSYLHKPFRSIAHNQIFYSEFSDGIDYENMRADELDSILDYVNRNNLTNVTVKTCDYNIEKYYPFYKSRLNLETDDLFLKNQNPIKKKTKLFQNFTKKFLCLNWRYTKHRHLISAFILDKSVYLSWNHKVSLRDLEKDIYFDMYNWKINYPEFYYNLLKNLKKLNDNVPIVLDRKIPEGVDYIESPSNENIEHNLLEKYYQDIFVDIVTESRFAQPTGNFSEKILQSVQYLKPFILIAPPKTLEYFKSFGFKTFNTFWDESYDDCFDHGERLAKIFNLITKIENTPIEELKEMYAAMTDIVNYNFLVYKNVFGN